MAIDLTTPTVDDLRDVIAAMRGWPQDGVPVQLHPGDLGWYWRFGADAVARDARTWSRDGEILAVGLLDGPELLRLAFAPDAEDDLELAAEMLADVSRPERGVLPPTGRAVVETRSGAFRGRLEESGWEADELRAPLIRNLREPVESVSLRIEDTDPDSAETRAEVQRAAFDRSTFTAERWHAMATGFPFQSARCLIGYDADDIPVAAATVWAADEGRAGLLEPMGVHRDHRRHGYGRAITLAAAAALRELGSSSAWVCTASANTAAVATYRSAGFLGMPDVPDLRRPE